MEEKDYVNSSYLYGQSNILDVSAIVGKNGSGKTTMLRIISKVLSGECQNYILLEENERKEYLLYSDMKFDLSKLKEDLKKRGYSLKICHELTKEYINSVYQIYFSNIFDKTKPLDKSDNLKDISTNYEIIKHIDLYLKNYQQKIVSTDSLGEEVIDAFKYSEIDKKMKFALAIKDIYLRDSKKMLFEFPEYIRIYLNDDIQKKNVLVEEIKKKLNEQERKKFIMVCSNIDNYLGKFINTEEDFEHHFIVYVIHEIILTFLKEEKCSFGLLIKALNILAERNDLQIVKVLLENESTDLQFSSVKKEVVKTYEKRNVLEMAYDEVMVILSNIEDADAYLEEEELWEIDEMLQDIGSLVLEQNSFNIQECLEVIQEKIHELLTNYSDLEIEDIQEQIEKVDNLLEDLRVAILQEQEEKLTLKESTQIESFSSFDELQTGKEDVLFTYELIVKKYEIHNKLKKILYKDTTRIDEKEESVKIRLKDQDTIEFYSEYKNMKYQTFKLVIDHEDLSSGHNAYLDMCARLFECADLPKIKRAEIIVLLLDEGEMFLHPQAQVKYIDNLLVMIKKIFPKKKVQIIVTTNSPLLVSDIQGANVLYLKEISIANGVFYKKNSELGKTFGANINSLLVNNFFMDEGVIGFFAKEKIDTAIKKLGKNGYILNEEREDFKSLISVIGEPLIRKKLQLMYEEKIDNIEKIDKDINFYKDIIRRLEQRKQYLEK